MRDVIPTAREEALERPKPLALLGLTIAFVALSIGTPYAIHVFGGPALGRTLLPMHFFALCSGLLLGWQSGLAVGILSPAISFSISGMPPFPMVLPMTFEIATYGLVAGLMTRSFRRNIWISLVTALASGRLAVTAAVALVGAERPLGYISGAFLAGLPGIAIQLVLLPLIARLCERRIPQ